MSFFKNKFFGAYGLWHWGEGFQTVLFTWYMSIHLNLSATQIGFFQALVLSPFLIFTIAGGVLTDRVGARLSYTVSTLIFGAILIGYGVLDQSLGYLPKVFLPTVCLPESSARFPILRLIPSSLRLRQRVRRRTVCSPQERIMLQNSQGRLQR